MDQTFTAYIFECGTKEIYTGCTFHAVTLRLYAPVRFTECHFPNLRHLLFEFDCKEVYSPFDDCTIPHKLNLDFMQDIKILLIGVGIASILTEDARVEVRLENELRIQERMSFIANYEVISKEIRYGDDPEQSLEHFKELFANDLVYFQENTLEENLEWIVLLRGLAVGKVIFKIIDHPFSKAVFLTDSPMLQFNGEIPANWTIRAHPEVVDKFEKIRDLKVNSIGERALTGLVIDLDKLEVTGSIEKGAFAETMGDIRSLIVNKIDQESFPETIRLGRVYVNQLAPRTALVAQTISIPSSQMVDGIKSVKTLFVREKYSGPIYTNACKVDLSTADGELPFRVHFESREITLQKPGVVYEEIELKLELTSGTDAQKAILNNLREKYLDLKTSTPIFEEEGDKLFVKLDGHTLAQCTVTYRASNDTDIILALISGLLIGTLIFYYN